MWWNPIMWQTNRRTQPFKVKDNLFIKLFRHYDKYGALCWPLLSDAGSLGSLSLAGGWALLSMSVIIWPLLRGHWRITLPQPRRNTTTKMRGWRSASTSQTGDIEIPAAGTGAQLSSPGPKPLVSFLNLWDQPSQTQFKTQIIPKQTSTGAKIMRAPTRARPFFFLFFLTPENGFI